MNIEQIAIGIKDAHGLDMSDEAAVTLLRHVLSKLAEQTVVPVAWQDKQTGMIYTTVRPEAKHLYSPLYTEAKFISAQQRTAEACAKIFERAISYQPAARFNLLTRVNYAAVAISNGEWRKYT